MVCYLGEFGGNGEFLVVEVWGIICKFWYLCRGLDEEYRLCFLISEVGYVVVLFWIYFFFWCWWLGGGIIVLSSLFRSERWLEVMGFRNYKLIESFLDKEIYLLFFCVFY